MTDVHSDIEPSSEDVPLGLTETQEQRDAKVAATHLGDMDAINLATAPLPEGADVPSAKTVRLYPWLFSQEVIDSFNTDDDMTDEERDAHNQAVADHWASQGAATEDGDSITSTDEPSPDPQQQQGGGFFSSGQ